MDSYDLKKTTVDRTVSQPSPGYQTGVGVSTSTSSLMVVASTVDGSTSTTVVTAAGGLETHVDPNSGNTVPDQHCPYNILHILSHLRQPEVRSQPSNGTRELVMRVTTVWGLSLRPYVTWMWTIYESADSLKKSLISTALDKTMFLFIYEEQINLWCPYMHWIKVKVVWFAQFVVNVLFFYIWGKEYFPTGS